MTSFLDCRDAAPATHTDTLQLGAHWGKNGVFSLHPRNTTGLGFHYQLNFY